jgi:hypothetical protein
LKEISSSVPPIAKVATPKKAQPVEVVSPKNRVSNEKAS